MYSSWKKEDSKGSIPVPPGIEGGELWMRVPHQHPVLRKDELTRLNFGRSIVILIFYSASGGEEELTL